MNISLRILQNGPSRDTAVYCRTSDISIRLLVNEMLDLN